MALLNATLEDTSELLGHRLVRVSDRLKRVLATPAKMGIVDYSRRFLKNLQGDLFVEKDKADTRPSTARTRQCAPPRVALCADGQSAAFQIHRARARSAATTTRRTPRQSGRPTPTPQHEAKWWDELCTEDSQLEAETLDAAENHGVDCASPVSRRQSTSVSICAAAKKVLRGSSKAPPDRTADDRKDGAGDNNREKYKPPTRPVTPMMKTRFKSDLLWIYEVRLIPAIKQIREREEVAALLAATMDPVKEPQPLQARTQRVLPLTPTPSRPSTPGNTGHIHRVAAQHAENGVFFPPRPHTAPRVEFCIPDSGCVHPHALSRLRPRRPGGTILRTASPALHEVRTSSPSPQQDIARTASPSPQQDIARTSSSSPQQDIARTSSPSPQQDIARTSSSSPQQDIARTSSPSPQQDIARTSAPSLADLTVRTDSPSLLETTTVRETAPRASRSLHTSATDNYTCTGATNTARRTSARSVTPSECARVIRSRREGVGRRRQTLRLRSTYSDPVSPWTPEEMQKWLHETQPAARRATRKSRQRHGMDVSSPLASPLDDAIRILVNKKTTRATLPYNSRKMQEIMQSVRWHDGRPEPIPIDIDAIDVPESTKPAFRLVTPRVKARTLPLQ